MPAWQVFYQPEQEEEGAVREQSEGMVVGADHHYQQEWIFIRVWTHNQLVMSPEPCVLILTYGHCWAVIWVKTAKN